MFCDSPRKGRLERNLSSLRGRWRLMNETNVSNALADLLEVYTRHLWLPDPGILYVTLGTVAANRMSGDPVWTLLVGSSSSGKSEMTSALSHLPEYFSVSTFTEAGLLSGVTG